MNKNITRLLAISIIALVTACGSNPSSESTSAGDNSSKASNTSTISSSSSTSSDTNFKGNELSTTSGLVVKFNEYGATIDSIEWNGTTIASEGFTVGRVANRIANGQFKLNGQTYNVSKNDGNNSLHGGTGSGRNNWRGPFATTNWTREYNEDTTSITYKIQDADGHNGYPGKMDMTVKYSLSQAGELTIEYTAHSDKDTLCNPTNHLFMQINGNTSYSNVNLQINASQYTPRISSTNKLPNGNIVSVTNTEFDYTTEKAFDKSKDYDDNLVLDGTGYRKVATMTGTTLGMKVEVYTDRPGLQLYKDGNGKICLETQMLPDAINQAKFEDPILRANETFYSKTTYCFSKVS